MKWWHRVKNKPYFIRLFHFEYWSTQAFYWPLILFYYPFLAFRSRHLCFFTATNPGIRTGGMGMESKYQTTLKIPEPYRPKTVLARNGEPLDAILEKVGDAGITFPLIAKPDIGYRGFLVKKISDESSLRAYLELYPIDFIIQEFIDLPAEIGILYYRFPGESTGRISSLTLKEFLSVEGDGRSSVLDLIQQKPRAILQMDRLQESHSHLFSLVPSPGERIMLGEIGNHCKGTFFQNGNHLIDQQLIETFDQISHQLDGIFYGRFDIRCTSLDDLRQGKNLKILEINGVCSEPTDIYDPDRSSYWNALTTILRHWKIIWEIGTTNHRNGAPYLPPMDMIREFAGLASYRRVIRKSVENGITGPR